MALRSIMAFGQTWDMEVERKGKEIEVRIRDMAGQERYRHTLPAGEIHRIDLAPAQP